MSVGFPDNVEEMVEKLKAAWAFQIHTGKRKDAPFPEYLPPTEQYMMTYGRYPVAFNWKRILREGDAQFKAKYPVPPKRNYHITFHLGAKGIVNKEVNESTLSKALDKAYALVGKDINESPNLIKWKITQAVYLLEIH